MSVFGIKYPSKEDQIKAKEMFKQIKNRDYEKYTQYETLTFILEKELMKPLSQSKSSDYETDLESICEIGFLQQLIDRKTGELLYHCLKQQRPDGKGKPVILSDGKNISSIKKICLACYQGFLFNRQIKFNQDAIKAITKFGNQDIVLKMYSCVHPENEMIFVSLGESSFPCKKTDTRVLIESTCLYTNCDYLHTENITVKIKDTEAYKEIQKQLENKGGD